MSLPSVQLGNWATDSREGTSIGSVTEVVGAGVCEECLSYPRALRPAVVV